MVETATRSVRIDDELWEQASEAARANRETVTAVIRRALVEYVKANAS